jgi:hypothetical protein
VSWISEGSKLRLAIKIIKCSFKIPITSLQSLHCYFLAENTKLDYELTYRIDSIS